MYSVIVLGTDIAVYFKPLAEALEIAEFWREQGNQLVIKKGKLRLDLPAGWRDRGPMF